MYSQWPLLIVYAARKSVIELKVKLKPGLTGNLTSVRLPMIWQMRTGLLFWNVFHLKKHGTCPTTYAVLLICDKHAPVKKKKTGVTDKQPTWINKEYLDLRCACQNMQKIAQNARSKAEKSGQLDDWAELNVSEIRLIIWPTSSRGKIWIQGFSDSKKIHMGCGRISRAYCILRNETKPIF